MERLKREEMYEPKTQGGKSFPDIKKYASLKYLSHIIKSANGQRSTDSYIPKIPN